MGGRGRAIVVALLVLAVAVVGGACQVKVAVGVEAKPDGSGRVRVTATLDKEAASQAGPFALDDLRRTGWVIDGPRPTAGGGAVLIISHSFRTPAEATRLVGEVGGAGGPFRDLHITTHRSLLETRTAFAATVDRSSGLNGFGDADLRRRLGAPGLGLDPAAVKQSTGVDLDTLFTLSVGVVLPGTLRSSNAPAESGRSATWQPRSGEKSLLTASAHQWNTRAIAFLALAAAAGLSALGLIARRLLARPRDAGGCHSPSVV